MVFNHNHKVCCFGSDSFAGLLHLPQLCECIIPFDTVEQFACIQTIPLYIEGHISPIEKILESIFFYIVEHTFTVIFTCKKI